MKITLWILAIPLIAAGLALFAAAVAFQKLLNLFDPD